MAAALCALSAITFSPQAKAAGQAVKQVATYDVYAGGFHVVAADLTVDTSAKKNYLLRLRAKTYGFIAKLAKWDGVFETKGWYNEKTSTAKPELHFSRTNLRDELELKEYFYNQDGTFKEYRIKDKNEDGAPKPIDMALTQNTTDALTSTLNVMNKVAQTGKCEGSDEVFDGKRRYRMHFRHKGEVQLEPSRYNAYSGPAIECTVEVEPVSGKWREKPRGWMSIQEQGRERGTMPTIWLAKLSEGASAMPVKIRVKTDYGTLFTHMTGYNGPGKTLKLAQE